MKLYRQIGPMTTPRTKLRLAVGVFAAFLMSLLAQNASAALDTNYGVGVWIWTNVTQEQQLCRFWRGFEIPKDDMVIRAVLMTTADNSYLLFLDGREIGRGGDWGDLTKYDVTQLLDPGPHVLAIEAFNDFDAAGVLVGLRVALASGRIMEIGSDESWKLVPLTQKGWETMTRPDPAWPAATVIGPLGTKPWGTPRRIITSGAVEPVILRFWQKGWFQIALLSVCGIALVVCVRQAGKLAMHSQSQQMVRRERTRIARDIHDDLTARLTQLILLSEVVQSSLPPGSEPCAQVRRISEKARELSRSMNEIIWLVNSQRDTLRDFASFVCKYAETFLEPTAIRCRFDLEEEMPDMQFDLGVRRNLFLAVKESLNNIVRHAQASVVTLRVRRQGHNIVVAIEDNGKGFDPAGADRQRNGLSNLMKRAAEAQGVCRVISQPGAGCRVEFAIPLAVSRQSNFRWLAGPRKVPEIKPPVPVSTLPTRDLTVVP
jgi:signal transduction histidine kinase